MDKTCYAKTLGVGKIGVAVAGLVIFNTSSYLLDL